MREDAPVVVRVACPDGCCVQWLIDDQPVPAEQAEALIARLRKDGRLVEGDAGDFTMRRVDEAKIVAAQQKRDRKARKRIERSA